MKCLLKWISILMITTMVCACTRTEASMVRMETTKGVIIIELNAEAAPKTTENFLTYVNSGFYNNTIFHRVIKGFMIQGGGFEEGLRKKQTQPPVSNEANNGLKNLKGTIAMARTMAPHSATSQFFINTVDNPRLDFKSKSGPGWGYCVFGRVIEGMDVVTAIENTPTTARSGYRDVPVDPIVIKQVTILKEKAGGKQPSDQQ